MKCKDCEARAARLRAALLTARMGGPVAPVVTEAAKGAAEWAGLKEKTAVAETEAEEPETESRKPRKSRKRSEG